MEIKNDRITSLFEKKKANQLLVGSSISSSDSMISEALAYLGFDILWVDMEHTPSDKREILSHITAIQGAGVPVLVRVPWNDPILVKPILEMGPDGIIFPMVSSLEEAEKAVKSISYPPIGCRGYGPLRANKYGADKEYLKNIGENLLCFIQIETQQAVDNIEEICSCPGLDGVLFGGMDLSASLGALGETNTPAFAQAVQKVCKIAKQRGKLVGCCAPDDEKSRVLYLSAGVEIYLASGDIAMMTAYARNMLSSFHNM